MAGVIPPYWSLTERSVVACVDLDIYTVEYADSSLWCYCADHFPTRIVRPFETIARMREHECRIFRFPEDHRSYSFFWRRCCVCKIQCARFVQNCGCPTFLAQCDKFRRDEE